MSNQTTTLLPFDLQKALAGDPVVTRGGRPVSQLIKFEVSGPYCVHGVINDSVKTFTVDGRFNIRMESGDDLFMKPKTEKVWANIYLTQPQNHSGLAVFFNDEETAKKIADLRPNDRVVAIAVPVEIPID